MSRCGWPVLLAFLVTGCGSDSVRAAAEASAADEVQSQETEIPVAILGEAPPPRGEDLAYFADDEATVGYIVAPEGEGPFPAVILIHEWNGLVDRVRQVADALADEGYVALAADMYSSRIGTSRDENMALMQEAQADPTRVIANLDAAVEYLRGRPDVTGKVAAMGWCFGGGVALSFALGGESHEGTAIFYGRLVEDPEVLASIDHPVYGTFAELDGGIPPEQVERFTEALREAGVENDIHIYDDVNHGFWLWVDRDPETAAGPAADAWARLKAYLGRVLD
ncbi:MAG: dienelactone hydrolase family protein [marine benthic group bacterium]|nr:dienelactone hydrolase family protein [Candidatus Benthicola marisminoris]